MADIKQYELVFITQPEIGTEEVDTLVQKLKDIVGKHEGSVTAEDRWGRRRMAYPIQGHREGFYDVLAFQSAGTAIADIEHHLKVTDSVIRHLLTRIERSKKPRKEKKPKAAKPATASPSASRPPSREPRSSDAPAS